MKPMNDRPIPSIVLQNACAISALQPVHQLLKAELALKLYRRKAK